MTRNEILSIRSLHNRPERRRTNRFIVEGVKGLIELSESNMEVLRIYSLDSMLEHVPVSLSSHIEVITTKAMARISNLKTPPGLMAIVSIPSCDTKTIIESSNVGGTQAPLPFVLVAAGIADPGNLGTLIRTADWFGMRGVLLTPGSTDAWSPKCVQATMGSIFRIPVAEIQPEDEALLQAQQHYALEMSGTRYTDIEWKSGLLWIGSESHGISTDASALHYETVHIPRQGGAESLNAGIAGAIVCSEIARVWTVK